LAGILTDHDGGLNAEIEGRLSEGGAPPGAVEIVVGTVGSELEERRGGPAGPVVGVSCERLKNSLREKFRTFSGEVSLVVEIRVSDDHSERADELLLLYLDALTEVLHRARGDWGRGVFYPGEYEIVFAPAKRGGKNTLHAAKLRLNVNVSV
jgi:hypothetical protein